jgi:molybdopterin-guanine dinucleotide biosynthesis protein A
MGRDKALVAVGGERMITRIVTAMHGRFAALWLAAPHDYGTGLPTIADWPEAPGPVGAIAGIALACHQHIPAYPAFLTIPVDAPLMTAATMLALAQTGASQIAADPARLHPTIGCWPVQPIISLIERQKLPQSLHGLVQELGMVAFPNIPPAELLNINRPEDIAVAELLLRNQV